MALSRQTKRALTFAFATAGLGLLAYAYNNPPAPIMPSSDEILGLCDSKDLTMKDMYNIRNIAILNNYDPLSMARAAAQQIYGYCMELTSDQITLAEMLTPNDHLGVITATRSKTINLASGANMTWTVEPETYKTEDYVNWYNDLNNGINERLCGTVLFVELKRLFTRFVDLALKFVPYDKILDTLQQERAMYRATVKTHAAEGGFAGTIWEEAMYKLDAFVTYMADRAPAGVKIDLTMHSYATPKF